MPLFPVYPDAKLVSYTKQGDEYDLQMHLRYLADDSLFTVQGYYENEFVELGWYHYKCGIVDEFRIRKDLKGYLARLTFTGVAATNQTLVDIEMLGNFFYLSCDAF